MGLRSISRKAVGGYIKVARVPVDAALKVLRGNGTGATLGAHRGAIIAPARK